MVGTKGDYVRLMNSRLVEIIRSSDPATRDQALDAFARSASLAQLLAEADALDQFRRTRENLYEQVRALFFLYAIHRFHLPNKPGVRSRGLIPYKAYLHLLDRRFAESIDLLLGVQAREGPDDAICSGLASAYHRLGFQTLADQVRRSVRSVRGNQWMFPMGHPMDQPLLIRPGLLQLD